MKPGAIVKWVGQVVVDKRSESVVFTRVVARVRSDGMAVVRIKTPEPEAKRLVVGAPSDFMVVAL